MNSGRTTQSDIDGRFSLTNLQPGQFTIDVAFGLLGTVLRRDVQFTQDTSLDLLWMPPMPPPAPVFTLRGRVTDIATRGPLAGVSLDVIDGVNTGRSTTTAADGTFEMTNLMRGGFTLRLRYTGYDSEFRAVRLIEDTTLDVQMRPAMQSLAGTWTGAFSYNDKSRTEVGYAVPEATLAHAGAFIESRCCGWSFTGTLRDPSAIASTTQVTGTITVFHSEGPPRAPMACNGTGNFTGTVNWARLVIIAPIVPLECGGAFTNVTLSLVRQH